MRHAQIAQPELRAGLGAFGNTNFLRTIESFNLNFSAQRGLRDIDRKRAMQIVFAALEDRVIRDFDDDIQIAGLAVRRTRIAFGR